MKELKNRGVEDALLAVVDGLTGFPDAIRFLRHSVDFVSYKDRKVVASALKDIDCVLDAATGEAT